MTAFSDTPKTRKVHGNAKLAWNQVELIRDFYDIGYPLQTLSRMFNAGTHTLWAIVTNKTWHDPDYIPKRGRRVLPIQSNVQG